LDGRGYFAGLRVTKQATKGAETTELFGGNLIGGNGGEMFVLEANKPRYMSWIGKYTII
jgi:hypothetical protein